MKVYSCPAEVPPPTYDFATYSTEKMLADEEDHQKRLVEWLQSNGGYKGRETGSIVSFGVADGKAQYMYADGGAKSVLIHLPYGDAYQYPDVSFLPRKEILKRIEQQKKFTELFKRKT